jgi:hypothetical protein
MRPSPPLRPLTSTFDFLLPRLVAADYLGTRQPRLTGDAYFEVVDEFIQAVFHRWPDVIVQFEDFESMKAVALLERCFPE